MDISKIIRGKVSQLIKEARNREGVSQQELADRIGKSRSMINNIEYGRQSVTVENLCAIAYSLDMNPTDFLPPFEKLKDESATKEIDVDPFFRTKKMVNIEWKILQALIDSSMQNQELISYMNKKDDVSNFVINTRIGRLRSWGWVKTIEEIKGGKSLKKISITKDGKFALSKSFRRKKELNPFFVYRNHKWVV